MWALVFIGGSPSSRSASPVKAGLGCRPQGAAGSGESGQAARTPREELPAPHRRDQQREVSLTWSRE